MKKNIFIGLLCGIILLGLSGCDTKDNEESISLNDVSTLIEEKTKSLETENTNLKNTINSLEKEIRSLKNNMVSSTTINDLKKIINEKASSNELNNKINELNNNITSNDYKITKEELIGKWKMIDGEENSQILEFTNDNVEVIEDYLLLKYGNRDTYMTASYIYVNNVLYVCDSYPLVKIK